VTTPTTVPARYTVRRYLALVDEGVLRADDPVELLEGLIVAEPPQDPPHASATGRVEDTLREVAGGRAVVRTQAPFVAGPCSLPEPDVALVPGRRADYDAAHPTEALLIVEVADSSLLQDRLTKAPIYAAAGVPECWIVNLRDDCVEVFRDPWPKRRRYATTRVVPRGDFIALAVIANARVAVDDLLPAKSAGR
jgi:Uma2 family endonuclease